MILLYHFENDEKGQVARQFLERAGYSFKDIDINAAGSTLQDLFAGKNPTHNDTEKVPEGSAICFSEEVEQEEAARIINTLQEIGLHFTYHVLADETNLNRTLADILHEHAEYEAFLGKINRLQQLINACAPLNEKNYDPDYWSELKFAIADANDFLDALFSESKSALHQFNPDDVEKLTAELEKATKKLLTK